MTPPRAAAARRRRPQPAIVAQALALLTPLGPVVPRGMFGGWGFYLDGAMFALVAGGALYFKTDDKSRPRFAAAGSVPFTYAAKSRAKRIETSYWRAPEGCLDGPQALLPWAELALAAARRKAAVRSGGNRPGRRAAG